MPKLLFARPPVDAVEERRIRKLTGARHAPADWIRRAQIIALTLLYPSSRRWSCAGSGPQGAEQGPGLAGKQALEAADDLGLALALEGSSGDVGAGGFVVLHPHDDRPVEGGVGLAVTAAVEPVAGGQTGGCRYRGDAAEPGQAGSE